MSSRYVFPNILTAIIDSIAKIIVRKNSGADIGARHRLNFIEGANVTLTIVDDIPDDEIDITIAATGGGGAANIKPITVNVPTPQREFKTNIIDADVLATSQIIFDWGTTSKLDRNSPSMENLKHNVTNVLAGSFDLELYLEDKEKLLGDYKLNYLVG